MGVCRGPAAGLGGRHEASREAFERQAEKKRFPWPEKSSDMSGAPCNLGCVFKFGATLCVLAVLTAQVPLIACDSDCHALLVSAALGHDCHTPGAHLLASVGAGHSHACGHQECHHGAPDGGHDQDGDGGDRDGGEHEVIQVPSLRAGVRLTLPVLSVLTGAVPSAPDALALPAAQLRLEVVRAGETDPLSSPPLGSVRLLL